MTEEQTLEKQIETSLHILQTSRAQLAETASPLAVRIALLRLAFGVVKEMAQYDALITEVAKTDVMMKQVHLVELLGFYESILTKISANYNHPRTQAEFERVVKLAMEIKRL